MNFLKRLPPRILATGIGLIILLLCIWIYVVHSVMGGLHHQGPMVNAVKVMVKPMPVYIIAPGNIESVQSASIIAQVSGTIQSVDFTPGQMVKTGQLLFTLSNDTTLAALHEAQAQLARDEANLVPLEADAKRFSALVKLEYVTQQQADQANASAAAQRALINADQAAIQQAQVQYGYTTITAPISGKTGDIKLKVGDRVTAYSSPLVIINQMDPLWVDFNISQSQLPLLLEHKGSTPLRVTLYTEGEQTLLGEGQLFFIDNMIEPMTGTILLKARLSNKSGQFWPGLSVMAHVLLKVEPHALVVPVTAVRIDDHGNFVYKVVNNHAIVQHITVDRQIGEEAVVSHGLTAQDRVITSIPPELENGALVRVIK